jgi:hypothetical protein
LELEKEVEGDEYSSVVSKAQVVVEEVVVVFVLE